MKPIGFIFQISLALFAGAAGAQLVGSPSGLQVTNAWALATPPGIEVGAAYFVITNRGERDRLIGVSSPAAERAEVHVTTMDGNLMRMQRVDTVDIPHGAATSFAPGGRHVMLVGLKQVLKAGAAFPLTLTFENAGSLAVQVRVQGTDRKASGGHDTGHSDMKHHRH